MTKSSQNPKLTISQATKEKFIRTAGRIQNITGTKMSEDKTLYYILEKYEEYESTPKEQEIEQIEKDAGLQEAPPVKKRRSK